MAHLRRFGWEHIDQIGACRCVHWHGTAFLWDHQVQKL
jgi:hypothetical protein